jgi:hypothetical protein
MKKSPISAILTLSLIMGLQFISCKNEDSPVDSCDCVKSLGKACVVYEETYCAEPWGGGFTHDTELRNEIGEFLASLSIELDQIGFEVTSAPDACYACSCKTGRTICGKVDLKDLEAIKELGFVAQ